MRFELRVFWRRWARYVLAAVLAHGLLVLLFVGWVIWKHADTAVPAPPQMMVFELPPAKAIAIAPPAPTTAPTGAPNPAPRKARADPQPLRDAPATLNGTMRAAESSEPETAEPAAADAAVEAKTGDADSKIVIPFGVDPPADAVAIWNNAVLAHLTQFKRYPEQARRNRLQDQVLMRVQVDRQGKVLDQGIVESRGLSLLDAEARAMVGRADPLPAPPSEATDADLNFVVTIEFTVGPAKNWMW